MRAGFAPVVQNFCRNLGNSRLGALNFAWALFRRAAANACPAGG
jgi:hypothetical protein